MEPVLQMLSWANLSRPLPFCAWKRVKASAAAPRPPGHVPAETQHGQHVTRPVWSIAWQLGRVRKPLRLRQLLSHCSFHLSPASQYVLLNLNPTRAVRFCLSRVDSKALMASGVFQWHLKTHPNYGGRPSGDLLTFHPIPATLEADGTKCQGAKVHSSPLNTSIARGHHPCGSCHRLLVTEMLNHLCQR